MGLASSGRRSMAARLRTVAGVPGAPAIEAVPGERLRYAQPAAIRAALEERELAPASINATRAALWGAKLLPGTWAICRSRNWSGFARSSPCGGAACPPSAR